MDATLSLLDRQVAALAGQEPAPEFLVSVEPFLEALRGEPRIGIHLEDLRDETIDRVRLFEEIDTELVPVLVDLRRRLVKLRSDLDDSNTEPPKLDEDDRGWSVSLARFDSVAKAEPPQLNFKGDGARSEQLLWILDDKAFSLKGKPSAEAEAWVVDLNNAKQRWEHATRWLQLRMRVSAGLALLRLESIPRSLNPEPVIREAGEDRKTRLDSAFRRAISTEQRLYLAVHTDKLDAATQGFVDDFVKDMRAGLERLSVELHRRLGLTRSRRALISRFKQRAQWYDARRLLAIAADDDLPGGPEERLTDELARFLFDQGLNPLTKPIVGGLQPDLLDPSVQPAFYVEAKQYKGDDRRGVVKALAQVLDTVGRLQSEAYPITEAFCVVFRRDGPRYVLPELVQPEGYRVYFTLVDIAPTEVSGRRQKYQPRPITEAELLDTAAKRSEGTDKDA